MDFFVIVSLIAISTIALFITASFFKVKRFQNKVQKERDKYFAMYRLVRTLQKLKYKSADDVIYNKWQGRGNGAAGPGRT